MSNSALLDWISEIAGKKPKDENLYIRAVTHGSFGPEDFQRLEFLGDRVLGLTIASFLYENFQDEPEGMLSQRLNGLVSGKVCGEIADALGASNHLLLGKQARDDGARQSAKVLGDVMEALIGAVYLDHGMEAAQKFVLRHWESKISGMARDVRHPKSALQEWAAAKNRKMPVYELVEKSGPHHDLRFTVKASVPNVGEVEATASSIQTAETAAAQLFLEKYT
ncbi:ribonuclease III [Parasphingorhabdus halotolerans]|uniref:ribonuclease III n=1 Tax=Parasphingorhabdus halotolerans TaxID=2725558 RepID=UPI001FE70EB7|nr:ribonuclease III [Parasphingorhabdus halotolerans]